MLSRLTLGCTWTPSHHTIYCWISFACVPKVLIGFTLQYKGNQQLCVIILPSRKSGYPRKGDVELVCGGPPCQGNILYSLSCRKGLSIAAVSDKRAVCGRHRFLCGLRSCRKKTCFICVLLILNYPSNNFLF